jgi:hypothetical protein
LFAAPDRHTTTAGAYAHAATPRRYSDPALVVRSRAQPRLRPYLEKPTGQWSVSARDFARGMLRDVGTVRGNVTAPLADSIADWWAEYAAADHKRERWPVGT